jgi:hypothetical protein
MYGSIATLYARSLPTFVAPIATIQCTLLPKCLRVRWRLFTYTDLYKNVTCAIKAILVGIIITFVFTAISITNYNILKDSEFYKSDHHLHLFASVCLTFIEIFAFGLMFLCVFYTIGCIKYVISTCVKINNDAIQDANV